MKNAFFSAVLLLAGMFALNLAAAEKLAVSEPVNKGGMGADEVEAVWVMLESSIDSPDYELVSRTALKSMLTELGLVNGSDLVDLNDSDRARLGEVKAVKYLLIPTVARLGARINLSLLMVDASTGSIVADKKITVSANSLDDLADRLNDALNSIALAQSRRSGKNALLYPVMKLKEYPEFLPADFNTIMEMALLDSGNKLLALKQVDKILSDNRLDALDEADPATYMRIGELLRADKLVIPEINRFELDITKRYIEASKREVITCIGNLDGNVRVIDAKTGEVLGVTKFRQKVDFRQLPASQTRDWVPEDYGKYLLEVAAAQAAAATTGLLK